MPLAGKRIFEIIIMQFVFSYIQQGLILLDIIPDSGVICTIMSVFLFLIYLFIQLTTSASYFITVRMIKLCYRTNLVLFAILNALAIVFRMIDYELFANSFSIFIGITNMRSIHGNFLPVLAVFIVFDLLTAAVILLSPLRIIKYILNDPDHT